MLWLRGTLYRGSRSLILCLVRPPTLTMTKNLWHAFIVRVFPGTLEEYYAAREIHLRERKKYSRTLQFVIGALLVCLPLFLLLVLGFLPIWYSDASRPFDYTRAGSPL